LRYPIIAKARRAGVLAAGSTLVLVAAAGWGAAPAGASTGLVTPANSLIIGSGSQAAFAMIQQLDDLFDNAPGCDQVATSGSQPLDFSCPSSSNPTFPPVSNGTTEYGYTENPSNDVALEEPPLGSSNGIAQLEDQGTHGAAASVPVADNIGYATSASAPSSSTDKGLTYVAYAEDGISWFHFTKVGGVATPSANVKSLTKKQLQEIFLKTGTTHITNWDQLSGGTNAPIDVFSPQTGSATLSTFKSYLGTTPSGSSGTAGTKNIILQNTDKTILARGATATADAIYVFPTSSYAASCKVATTCGGVPLPTGDANGLGEITGVTPNQANILNGDFPIHRYIYNVYSNGSDPDIPEASAAVLNFASEDGFICKAQRDPNGNPILDPTTGIWYHTEIDKIIADFGFIPLKNGVPVSQNTQPFEEGKLLHTAYSLLSAVPAGSSTAYGAQYLPWDKPTVKNTNPLGYCLASTTTNGGGPT
jgi:ABC-type phosphate transport system substrate-binding protein